MRLPAIPFLTKTVTTQYFIALIFESEKITSILFKEQEKSLDILSSNEKAIDLDKSDTEELVVASDNVISRSEISLPDGANLEKTIFVTPYFWTEDGRIKPERLTQLKKISEELALTPMGFIVGVEAVVAFIQKKEGAPVNGIFVEVGERIINIYIVRGSNIIDVQTGAIDESVEKTVERLLGNVTKLEYLPPKIILMHTKETEEISQRFLSHHWTKDLSFIHLPQVSILQKNFENEAIVSGIASQLNANINSGFIEASGPSKDEEDRKTITSESEDFGFAAEEDVATAGKDIEKESDILENNDNFEFDKAEDNIAVKKTDVLEVKEASDEEVFEDDDVEQIKRKKRNIGSKISSLITPKSVMGFINSFRNFRKFIIPFCALVVVVILLISYYSFVIKAKVIVFTDQKAFSENAMDINLTSTKESSFEDKLLKITTIDETVEGEQSQESTGSKDTGQKATGSLTIFNKTESPKNLDKGTTLVSSNNLEFTLNDDVNIASTSSFSTSFSNASAKVTAESFGKEYNLPSQTNFTIKGISSSDVFAKNDQAFSGGSKEQIQVVSKKDLQGLEDSLVARLFDKAKSQAQDKVPSSDALIPTYLSYEFESKKFDRKENDEAKNLKLNAKIVYQMGLYNKGDLEKFISSSDEFDVPDEFKLSDSESSIKITDISGDGKNLSAKLSFKAVFKPQLDEKKIPEMVAGKGTGDAVQKLKQVKGVSDVSIQYSNSIPFLPQIVPLNKNNISLEFKAQ